jgi:DNA-binding MarR family transcriptional regulator
MGLLERVPHATDRRQVVLTLTDSGRAVADSDVAERERVLAERLGELSDDERTTLAEAARILTEIVEKNE